MKVEDLIETLERLDPELEVVLSSDSEGNSFSPCSEYGIGFYVADSAYYGSFYNDQEELDEENKSTSDAVQAVVLWPTN